MDGTQPTIKKPAAIFGLLAIAAPFVGLFVASMCLQGGFGDLAFMIGSFRRSLIFGFALAVIAIWRHERWRALPWVIAICYAAIWLGTMHLVTPIF